LGHKAQPSKIVTMGYSSICLKSELGLTRIQQQGGEFSPQLQIIPETPV
jgi:hypothetical protein